MQYSKEKKYLPNLSNKIKKYLEVDFILLFISFFIFLYFIYVLFLGEKNIFHLIQKEKFRAQLENEIEHIKKENSSLREKINYLKTDNFFIEKKAREDLGLVKAGEEIYILVDKNKGEKKDKKRWIDKIIEKYQEFRLR